MEQWEQPKHERRAVVWIVLGVFLAIFGILWIFGNQWGRNYVRWELIMIGLVIIGLGFFFTYSGIRRQLRYSDYLKTKPLRAPTVQETPSPVPQIQRIEERKETVIREIVMVKCSYCGARNPQEAQKCSSCGARL